LPGEAAGSKASSPAATSCTPLPWGLPRTRSHGDSFVSTGCVDDPKGIDMDSRTIWTSRESLQSGSMKSRGILDRPGSKKPRRREMMRHGFPGDMDIEGISSVGSDEITSRGTLRIDRDRRNHVDVIIRLSSSSFSSRALLAQMWPIYCLP
jgi:hypothetical protein